MRFGLAWVAVLFGVSTLQACTRPATRAPAGASGPPIARVEAVVEERFGTRLVDAYRWMEAPKSAELAAWLEGQGDYTRGELASIPGRAALLARAQQIADGGRQPRDLVRVGARLFYMRLDAGAEVAKLVVREGNAERVLVDPELRKRGNAHMTVDSFSPSPDGKLVAYGVAEGGSEVSTLHVMDVGSGRDREEAIPRVWGEFHAQWSDDSASFYYPQLAEDGFIDPSIDRFKNMRVYRHRLGERADLAVFDKSSVAMDPEELPWLGAPRGTGWVLGIVSGARMQRRVFVAKTDASARGFGAWTQVAGYDDAIANATIAGDSLYLASMRGPSNGRVLRVPLAHPVLAEAEVVVPEGDAVIDDIVAARDGLYVASSWAGRSSVRRFDYATRRLSDVPLPYAGAADDLRADPRHDGVTFALEDWAHPTSYLAFAPATGTTELRVDASYPIASDDIASEEVEVTSPDGEKVPLSIVHSKRAPRDGKRPTILYGYGAYGISMSPHFNTNFVPWLEHGGVWAVAHVRGGGEKGERWRVGGTGPNKPKGVADFVACAQYMVREGYTSPGTLAAVGASMGGVLAGRAVTEHPELFAAASIQVGEVNVLRYEAMNNGANQRSELGSPDTEAGFRALLAMDVLQNVRDGVAYPAMLLTTGLNDQRVPPWTTAKLGARMQAATSSGRPILVRVSKDEGHGHGSTRAQRYTLYADTASFFLQQFGDADFAKKESANATR